jgi:hypothetical protein
MALNPIPSHPSSLSYVLKLHRDSRPAQGQLSGLIEHVTSGKSLPFDDAAGLLGVLLAHAAAEAARAGERSS